MQEISLLPSAKYVDLYKERKYGVFSSDVNRYYAKDFFYPSNEEYAIWYTDIISVIHQQLQKF